MGTNMGGRTKYTLRELEKAIENRVVNWAKKYHIKMRKKERGELIDRWFLLPKGKLFIIEFKRPGKYSKGRQANEIRELKELGYDIERHDNSDEAIEAIKKRLGAAWLSKESRKIRDRAERRRAVLRSRFGKDKYNPRRNKNSKERKTNK